MSIMAKRTPNTNFRLGLHRKALIEAAQIYGRSEKAAKKDSTKRLEEYVARKIGGKGTKVPDFSDREMRDVKTSLTEWGVGDALKILTYRIEKISGTRDETNFLRLTISRSFQHYYKGNVESRHIDELISKLPQLGASQVDSDMLNISPYYAVLYQDYAAELQAESEDKTEVE